MLKNVLLLYPPIDGDYHMDGANDSPPLGLIALQNYIVRHLKLEVNIEIVDGEYSSVNEIMEMIATGKFDIIGAQPMMASYKNTMVLMEAAKKKGMKTFLGGHHATQLKYPIMKNKHHLIDYIIVGDGEEAFAEVVKETAKEHIPNLVYYENDQVICTPERNVPMEHGVIDYIDSRVLEQYNKNMGRNLERGEKLISFRSYSHKGCSNRLNSQYCFFCGRADRGVRFKKPADYVREIEYLSNIPGAKYIFEIGDDFLQDSDWLNEVVELRERSAINQSVHLKIFARANRITEDIIPILRKLNIDEVAIGFESGSEKILKNINKNATPNDNLIAAELLFENGIDTIASFVLGLPGECEESLHATYEQAVKIRDLALKHLGKIPQEIIANLIEINPGAPAFKKLQKHNPVEYMDEDNLNVYKTQNDYFKMEFNLKSDEDLVQFRNNLRNWGTKINKLGAYTYPAGWKLGEV